MERTKELEKLSLLEQKKNREDKQRQTRITTLKVLIFIYIDKTGRNIFMTRV